MFGKGKYILIVLCVALVVCIAMLLHREEAPAEASLQPDVEISLRLSKEKLVSLVEEKGIKLSGKARVAMSLIPDTLTLVFDTDSGEENSLSELRINGQKISNEILSDICENYLDFGCVLVYNRT